MEKWMETVADALAFAIRDTHKSLVDIAVSYFNDDAIKTVIRKRAEEHMRLGDRNTITEFWHAMNRPNDFRTKVVANGDVDEAISLTLERLKVER